MPQSGHAWADAVSWRSVCTGTNGEASFRSLHTNADSDAKRKLHLRVPSCRLTRTDMPAGVAQGPPGGRGGGGAAGGAVLRGPRHRAGMGARQAADASVRQAGRVSLAVDCGGSFELHSGCPPTTQLLHMSCLSGGAARRAVLLKQRRRTIGAVCSTSPPASVASAAGGGACMFCGGPAGGRQRRRPWSESP